MSLFKIFKMGIVQEPTTSQEVGISWLNMFEAKLGIWWPKTYGC